MEKQQNFNKPFAQKIRINQILIGKYFKSEDQSANYLLTIDNEKIYRANIIATIIRKEEVGTIQNIYLEDGSGTILARFFEETEKIASLEIGDVVLCIGRIREFSDEKYISPEIIKKVSSYWLKVRSLECKETKYENNDKKDPKNTLIETQTSISEETFPFQKILKLIKELDTGEGVYIEEVITKSTLNKVEELIEKMLERGDIFQNSPGRIKVL